MVNIIPNSNDYVIKFNSNKIFLTSWIEKKRREDGDYDLIGMGCLKEYDAETGILISDKSEPTGAIGWAPRKFIEGASIPFWKQIFITLMQRLK